ncbi:MAG: hypothetical protein GY838_03830 [bacterium]|nr:hypothetical protein [bacterium]
MTDIETYYPSPFLKAADLGGEQRLVTIAKISPPVSVGMGDDKKPLIHFDGAPKPMVLNVTNFLTIKAMYGSTDTDWVGRQVFIVPTTTEYQGKVVPCIRVKPGVPTATPEQPLQNEPPPPPPPEKPEKPAAPMVWGGATPDANVQ